MKVQTKEMIIDVVLGTLATGLGFGVGCLAGHVAKGPVLLTGGIYAITALAHYALDKLVKFMGIKFDWKLSTVKFAQTMLGVVLTVASSVALFALGFFGPIGLGVSLGLGLALCLLPLGLGLYAKFGGKDLPYKEAVEKAKLQPKVMKVDQDNEGAVVVEEITPEAIKYDPFYKYAI